MHLTESGWGPCIAGFTGPTGPALCGIPYAPGSFNFTGPNEPVIASLGFNQAFATVGQTFIPSVSSAISAFAFSVQLPVGPANDSFRLQAYLYAWDETARHPVGSALYVSSVVDIMQNPTILSFRTCVSVQADQRYVIFLSTSGLWTLDSGGLPRQGSVTFTDDTSIPSGTFVYVDTANNPAAFTTSRWGESTDFSGGFDFGCSLTYASPT